MNDDGFEHRLWYTRRGNVVQGPFPEGQIMSGILLGRIRPTDELSQDRETWRSYVELPQLVPDVMRDVRTARDRERLRLARLHADERQHERRHRSTDQPDSAEQRRRDRRAPEAEDMVKHRSLRAQLLAAPAGMLHPYRLPLAIGVVVVLLFAANYAWRATARNTSAARDCAAPAAPGVNWTNCPLAEKTLTRARLSGATLNSASLIQANLEHAALDRADLNYADLRGASLRYADLNGATLTGAMLQNAALNGANLSRTDLRYADFRGADVQGATLTGADLSRATWIDGRACADGSVGSCK
jgi:Pentapeptide repeats (8 copies)